MGTRYYVATASNGDVMLRESTKAYTWCVLWFNRDELARHERVHAATLSRVTDELRVEHAELTERKAAELRAFKAWEREHPRPRPPVPEPDFASWSARRWAAREELGRCEQALLRHPVQGLLRAERELADAKARAGRVTRATWHHSRELAVKGEARHPWQTVVDASEIVPVLQVNADTFRKLRAAKRRAGKGRPFTWADAGLRLVIEDGVPALVEEVTP